MTVIEDHQETIWGVQTEGARAKAQGGARCGPRVLCHRGRDKEQVTLGRAPGEISDFIPGAAGRQERLIQRSDTIWFTILKDHSSCSGEKGPHGGTLGGDPDLGRANPMLSQRPKEATPTRSAPSGQAL